MQVSARRAHDRYGIKQMCVVLKARGEKHAKQVDVHDTAYITERLQKLLPPFKIVDLLQGSFRRQPPCLAAQVLLPPPRTARVGTR